MTLFRPEAPWIACAVVLPALIAVACGDSDSGAPPSTVTPSDAGAEAIDEACPRSGMGTLTVTANGLPAGTKGKVTIEGPAGKTDVEAPGSISLPGGSYAVVGGIATSSDPIARTVHTAGAGGSACVKEGTTANIELSFSIIPSSGKVWMLTGDRLSSYASSKLGATSSQTIESYATVPGATAFAFERDGGVWIAAGVTLRHFPASTFDAPGEHTADFSVDVPATPETESKVSIGGMAFDAAGTLWYSATGDDKLRGIAPADLRVTGVVTKYLALGGVSKPTKIVFDATGNLWVLDKSDRGVVRFAASKLGANQEGPDGRICPHDAYRDGDDRMFEPSGMAFDSAGNLWVQFNGSVVRLTPADLTNGDPEPAVQIVLTSGSWDQIVFDESGGLWTNGALASEPPAEPAPPTIVRYAPSQLLQASEEGIEPERTIDVAPGDFVEPRYLTIFPPPTGLTFP